MIAVVGEALIDLTPAACDGQEGFVPRAGGSPFNVAIGVARLGAPASFVGRLSTDPFGRGLQDRLTAEGVDTTGIVRTDDPTTLAVIQLDAEGRPSYGFYRDGTSALGLTSQAAAGASSADIVHVGCGAVSLVDEPAGSALVAALRDARGRLTSFDPNVRPHLVPDRAAYVARVEAAVAACGLVKVSDEDLAWLHPDREVLDVAHAWRRLGPALVVVTRGAQGAVAVGAEETEVPGREVAVVDTVGAGDSFTAALLVWLHEHGVASAAGLGSLDATDLRDALSFAGRAAAVTCTRRGADPPRRGELTPR